MSDTQYQTLRKSDLDEAIQEELAAWEDINKDVPPHLRSVFMPKALESAGTWPLVEESMEARQRLKIDELARLSKLNDELMTENMKSMTELTKTLRLLSDERAGSDFKDVAEPYKEIARQFRNKFRNKFHVSTHLRQNASQYHMNDSKPEKFKNSPKWLDPEYSMTKKEIDYQYLLADIKRTRMEHWGNTLIPEPEVSKHWFWKYCFPYVSASGIIAVIAHLIISR